MAGGGDALAAAAAAGGLGACQYAVRGRGRQPCKLQQPNATGRGQQHARQALCRHLRPAQRGYRCPGRSADGGGERARKAAGVVAAGGYRAAAGVPGCNTTRAPCCERVGELAGRVCPAAASPAPSCRRPLQVAPWRSSRPCTPSPTQSCWPGRCQSRRSPLRRDTGDSAVGVWLNRLRTAAGPGKARRGLLPGHRRGGVAGTRPGQGSN